MIPRVPSTKGGVGTSFRGTAAYLLHDENKAKSADRVLWTDTRNLGTDDPELAARLMAATAKDAERLKREHHEAVQSELPEDERSPYRAYKPSKNHVWHYSLAWSGEHDGPTLTRDEMMKAAYSSLRELGADHLQAVIVAHAAETNPHVHVMVNRINPETGATETPERNAKYKLSDWALGYERERGQILCKQREVNAAMRAAELPYDQFQTPTRKQRDAEASVADIVKRDPAAAKIFRDAEIKADKTLGAEARAMQEKHRDQWAGLSRDHRFRKAMINSEADDAKKLADRDIRKGFIPKFEDMKTAHSEEQDAFTEREARLSGKVRNITEALKHAYQTRNEDERGFTSQAFDVLANTGARLEALKRAQGAAERGLSAEMKREIGAAIRDLEATRKEAIHSNFERYGQDKADLELRQSGDKAANRAAWNHRDKDRVANWQKFAASVQVSQDFETAVSVEEEIKAREEDKRRKENQWSSDPNTRSDPRTSDVEAKPSFDKAASPPRQFYGSEGEDSRARDPGPDQSQGIDPGKGGGRSRKR